jgi:hypothetical protein
MSENFFANERLAVVIARDDCGGAATHRVAALALRRAGGWHPVLEGIVGGEFSTSAGACDASACEAVRTADGGWEVRLAGRCESWEAESVVTLSPGRAVVLRRQTYRFLKPCTAAIHPGFRIPADPAIRYTFALRAHERPLAGLGSMRAPADWAVPFPVHAWHDGACVAVYGADRTRSGGTLDFEPEAEGAGIVRVYHPDTVATEGGKAPPAPGPVAFAMGDTVTVAEMFAAKELAPGEEPLLEAERMAASVLLQPPRVPAGVPAVAAGIARFYRHCELWEPDALGPGRGWMRNMWVRTQVGPARKQGEMSGYFDLGWGEGIAVEMWLGVVRHWQRTGDPGLLSLVDEMTRNMDFFRRGEGARAPYYDRTDGRRRGDFLMDLVPGDRIWTHALAHTGSQLIQLYQEAPAYPNPSARAQWLAAAASIGGFLADRQREDGDLQDIFDADNREVNTKPHRIAARVVAAGLWARLGSVTGEADWTRRAVRLARAVAPEIERQEYYNQMLDGLAAPDREFVDGEAACYALEGLVPLFTGTRDPGILSLCRKAAAFAIAWTYFYDLPLAHRGIARGGQCCRMDDFPLLYPIGPAKAMEPLLTLGQATDDAFLLQMADEMAAFIASWQIDAPGKPWDGGMLHALGQYCGKHWGPDLAGQVDSGMATGNSLAALEWWLAKR